MDELKSSTYQIDYQCPQCGAPAVLEETDRLFQCEYCKVKSYLIEKDYFRYRFRLTAPETAEVVYFPYWRFKGMIFSCFQGDIKHRFADMSFQAAESPFFPISLGLRSQALKLQFVSIEDSGYYIRPTVTMKRLKELVQERFKPPAFSPAFEMAIVGETLTVIYVPFYVTNQIIDAIINKPASELPEDMDIKSYPGGKPDWGISIIAAICPNCGWDLKGEKNALVLHCPNCSSLWQVSGNRLKQLPFAHISGDHLSSVYLPFWRIRADIKGYQLASYADMIRAANMARMIQEKWESTPFYFWIPAFKISPQQFLRLSTNMTVSQPLETIETTMPNGIRHPVTLHPTEAVEMLKTILSAFVQPRKLFREKLPQIQVIPKKLLLVYVPFYEDYHEYIQPKFVLTVNKNLLGFSKNL